MKKLARSVEYLHQIFSNPIRSESLDKFAGLSLSQFERAFRKAFSSTPRQYMLRTRIENACRLLADTDDSIASIAQQCGFYDHPHFTRAFLLLIGLSPSQFRRSRHDLAMASD